MKKILLLAILFFSTNVLADNRSTEVLERMTAKIKAYPAYEVKYKAVSDGGSAEGVYMVKGNKYYIKAGQTEVFSDGKERWMVEPQNREVTVDNVDPKDRSLFGNPTKIFDFLDGNFTHSYLGRRHVDGKECDVVLLKPVDGDGSFDGITLMVDVDRNLPVKIEYEMAGGDSGLEIYIVSIALGVDAADSRFVYPKERFKGYETIDFR